MQYLIIGDIHGDYYKLIKLLKKTGFTLNQENIYDHPTIKAIFVGDLIDRGKDQLLVLNTVRKMAEHGSAYISMGNHELNAIGYSLPHPNLPNTYLRERNAKNTAQHQAFLDDFPVDSLAYTQWIEWFKTLPLFLEFDDFNVIHAFWDENLIAKLKPYLNTDHSLKTEYWEDVFNPAHLLFTLTEKLLKGLEADLPNDVSYLDKDKNIRHQARIKWWKLPETLLEKVVIGSDDICNQLKGYQLDPDVDIFIGNKPIFIGHYWLNGEPDILSKQVICVDFSAITPNGKLVGYLYQKQQPINVENFIYTR